MVEPVFTGTILDEIYRIEDFLQGWTENEFLTSDVTADHYAVVRGLEIIGEAASKVSQAYRNDHPELPWRDMIDMRNKVIHEYLSVEYSVVWKTATEDLPLLKRQIESVLKA